MTRAKSDSKAAGAKVAGAKPSPVKRAIEAAAHWFERPLVGHIVTVFVAIITAFVTVQVTTNQMQQDQRAALKEERLLREIKAYETWERFSELSLEHADIASARVDTVDSKNLEKLKWYMERLLIAAEQIVLSSPGDEQWEIAVAYELKPRFLWFLTEDFLGLQGDRRSMRESSYCSYVPPVRAIVRKAVVQGFRELPEKGASFGRKVDVQSADQLERRFDEIEKNCDFPPISWGD